MVKMAPISPFKRSKCVVFAGLISFVFLFSTTSSDYAVRQFKHIVDKVKGIDEYRETCGVNQVHDNFTIFDQEPTLPVVYLITPTYARREQIAELTRLSQTLMLVKNVVWLVAEDSQTCSSLVANFLRKKYPRPYVHIAAPMPTYFRESSGDKPRGVSGRRAGLQMIIDHAPLAKTPQNGAIYFVDDDNTYDVRLFEEIRKTKVVSVFPVGLILSGISSPIVKGGKVVGFYDDFPQRKFAMDMAGFAVGLEFLLRLKDKVDMPYRVYHEEDLFLQSLDISIEDLEPLADNCTEVLVWHTKTMKANPKTLHDKDLSPASNNLKGLFKNMLDIGMAVLQP